MKTDRTIQQLSLIVKLVLVISLSFPVSSALADTWLSGKEIKQLVSNKTAIGSHKMQARENVSLTHTVMFKTYFNANGQLIEKVDSAGGSTSSGGQGFPAHGTWKVAKGKLCFSFKDSLVDRGKMKCLKVRKKGDGTYELCKGTGEVNRVWKQVVSGNPHSLK